MKKDYQKIGVIEYKTEKHASIFMTLNFVLFTLVGVALIICNNLIEKNTINTLWIVLGCFIYMIFHECIHLLFMKFFSKETFDISVKFPTISVGSKAKFTKNQFISIALAPATIFACILILLVIITSPTLYLLWSILLTLNFASSGGDFYQVIKVMKYPRNTYFEDTSLQTIIYR